VIGCSRDRSLDSESGLLGVGLRTVVDLNVVHDDFTIENSAITLDCAGSDNLSAPTLYVFTDDLDISGEQDDFSSNVNAIILIGCRCSVTPVVVIDLVSCRVECHPTVVSVVSKNSHNIMSSVSGGGCCQTNSVSCYPIKSSFDLELSSPFLHRSSES